MERIAIAMQDGGAGAGARHGAATPRLRGCSGVRHGAHIGMSGVRPGVRLAMSGGRYGAVWRRHSEPRCGAAIKATPLGDHLGVVPCQSRTGLN
jgi:hypothetical protein